MQGERGEVYLKKWFICSLIPSPISRAKHCIPLLTCLAASYLPFLPNHWSSSGISLTTRDDEIQQMSFRSDFWCRFADSGGLGPTRPFLLTWERTMSYLPSSPQSSPPAARKTQLCLQINISYFTILLTPMSAALSAPGTVFSRKTGSVSLAALWARLVFSVTCGKSMKSYLSLRNLRRCYGGLDNLFLTNIF